MCLPIAKAAREYCYPALDFGLYTQAIHLISRGDPNPWLTLRQLHIFNDHFDPVLFIVAPLARFWPAWQVALFSEFAIVALSTVPVWWLQRRGRLSAGTAVLISALLVLGPGVVSALGFPVHPTTWAVLPIAWLGAALVERRTVQMVVALLLLFACKEEFPFGGLMLGVALIATRQTRPGVVVVGLSVAWLAVAFGLRPWLLGDTTQYGGRIFAGILSDPLSFVRSRLGAQGLLTRNVKIALPIVPFAVFMATQRTRWNPIALSLLVPMLAIRLLGQSWLFHYGAPVGATAAAPMMSLGKGSAPVWLAVAVALALAVGNEDHLRFAAHEWGLPVGGGLYQCSSNSARLAALDASIAHLLADTEGPALVQGSLTAQLVSRPDLYWVGGLQPDSVGPYRYVLVEKPPFGVFWPYTPENFGEFVQGWRRDATQILRDDEHVFFAAGHFTAPPAPYAP